jgi:hypothetical protein
MAIKQTKHLTLQDPPKFPQIEIFGLKILPSGNPVLNAVCFCCCCKKLLIRLLQIFS